MLLPFNKFIVKLAGTSLLAGFNIVLKLKALNCFLEINKNHIHKEDNKTTNCKWMIIIIITKVK